MADNKSFINVIKPRGPWEDIGADYDKEAIYKRIENTAKMVANDLGIDNIPINIVEGYNFGFSSVDYGKFTRHVGHPEKDYINIFVDQIWNNFDDFESKITDTIAHEMRHVWQNYTEAGSNFEKVNDIYNKDFKHKYNSYQQYYNQPREIDARRYGEEIANNYEQRLNSYLNNNSTSLSDVEKRKQYLDERKLARRTLEESKQPYYEEQRKKYEPKVKEIQSDIDADNKKITSIEERIKQLKKNKDSVGVSTAQMELDLARSSKQMNEGRLATFESQYTPKSTLNPKRRTGNTRSNNVLQTLMNSRESANIKNFPEQKIVPNTPNVEPKQMQETFTPSKETVRSVRQWEREQRIARSSSKEALDETTEKWNDTAKKYKEVNKKMQDMKQNWKDGGSINSAEYAKLQNLKDKYNKELEQIKIAREQFSQQYFLGKENVDTLMLNPPREGAPMFEGLAVSDTPYVEPKQTLKKQTQEIDDATREKIKQLTEQERVRFEDNQKKDFMNRMKEIEDEYNAEAARIAEEYPIQTNTGTKQKLNNKFKGSKTKKPNNVYTDKDIIDKIIGKQNPGLETSRVFDYNGTQYAVYKNLQVNPKDLSKGLIGGQIVDVNSGKVLNVRDAFTNLNQALMNGDLQSAMNELENIKSAGHTLPRKDVEDIISRAVNSQAEQQQQARDNQQQTIDNQQQETENENRERHEEEKENFEENHESNKDTSQNGSGGGGGNEPPDGPDSTDLPDPDDMDNGKTTLNDYINQRYKDIESRRPKTRKQKRLERISHANKKLKGKSGKKLVKGSKKAIEARGLSGKKFRAKSKVKGGSLKQIVANTLVNSALETVEKDVFKMHPDMFADLDQFADLTDDDIKHFADMIIDPDDSGKLKNQKIKEWRHKRREAKKARDTQKRQKISDNFDEYVDGFFEDYKNRFYGNYTGNQTINGFEYNGIQGHYDPKKGWNDPDYTNPESYSKGVLEFEYDDNGNLINTKGLADIEYDENGKVKSVKRTENRKDVEIKQNKKPRMRSGSEDDIFGWMKKHGVGIAEGLNVLFTIGSYKDARKEGHGVVSSAVRAAGSFVVGEMLGFWGYMGLQAAVGLPKAAIKGAELLYKENRKMNSAANQQIFGGAQFADNQQLATMRQSGMEMAKMAQYNLQQTLMGNEATYLHR